MTINLAVHQFMRCLDENDIERCMEIARSIEASSDDFDYMLMRPETRASAAILNAFGENPTLPRYWIFERNESFNPHRLTEDELDRITENDSDWHHHPFIVKQPYLKDETIIAKCKAVGWDSDEMLVLARCESVAASRAINSRTTRDDVRSLLLINRVVF